jgi:hypothetical protein
MRRRRRRISIHGSVGAGLNFREATKMANTVQVLLLGIVIISTIGSIFGYLLEPGRFEKRDAVETAINPSGVEGQGDTGERSSSLAA